MTANERRFDPAKMQRLDAPDRGEHFPIEKILDAIGIAASCTVADIGAGTGYFTLPLADRVALGKVFAVDPSPELLQVIGGKLASYASNDAPRNVELISGEACATTLADASCDLIFLSAVWHEIDDHPAVLREFHRVASPNARLAVVDWSPEGVTPPGPPLAHRIARTQVHSELTAAGWNVLKSEMITASTYLVLGQR
jgi:ubiquinone/menaquinone biosynthesis C-methylase UbiE